MLMPIAAAVWLGSLLALMSVMPSTRGNIWESGDAMGISIMLACIGSFWFAFWAYAKGKGYSGWLGIVLPLFSVIGLIVLVVLKDKHPESVSSSETK